MCCLTPIAFVIGPRNLLSAIRAARLLTRSAVRLLADVFICFACVQQQPNSCKWDAPSRSTPCIEQSSLKTGFVQRAIRRRMHLISYGSSLPTIGNGSIPSANVQRAAGRPYSSTGDLLFPLGTRTIVRVVFAAVCLFLTETEVDQRLRTRSYYFKDSTVLVSPLVFSFLSDFFCFLHHYLF